MSSTTSNLELFKYNTTADASTPFSITNALNNNWDKIDTFAGTINTLFNGDLSSATGKNLFSDINTQLGQKLEAEVLLEENGYIKFNNGIKIGYMFIHETSSTNPIVSGTNEVRYYTPPITFKHIKCGIVSPSHRVNVLYSYSLINNTKICIGAYGPATAYSVGFNCFVFVLGD